MTRSGGYSYWERIAPNFDRFNDRIVGRETEEIIDRWLSDNLKPGDAVLEMGCGTGRHAETYAAKVSALTAVDQAPAMVELSRKRLESFENVAVLREDCFHTSFEDASFDAVVMGNLLHIVRPPEGIIKEAFRLLKPKGRLMAFDYTGKGMSPFALLLMMFRILTSWGLPSTDNRMVDPKMLGRMVSGAGFDVRESALVGPTNKAVLILAEKPSPQ